MADIFAPLTSLTPQSKKIPSALFFTPLSQKSESTTSIEAPTKSEKTPSKPSLFSRDNDLEELKKQNEIIMENVNKCLTMLSQVVAQVEKIQNEVSNQLTVSDQSLVKKWAKEYMSDPVCPGYQYVTPKIIAETVRSLNCFTLMF
jgi:hypothetical protein